MSDGETSPVETVCVTREHAGVELLDPRHVPLGGPRAMNVRRPCRKASESDRRWCFLDHYGQDRVAHTGRMKVPRHPHTGLLTVSWLFTGEVEHRDSAGSHALVHRVN
jgi:redox-sensitive bicupin YhaK (pirin superfamily)